MYMAGHALRHPPGRDGAGIKKSAIDIFGRSVNMLAKTSRNSTHKLSLQMKEIANSSAGLQSECIKDALHLLQVGLLMVGQTSLLLGFAFWYLKFVRFTMTQIAHTVFQPCCGDSALEF